MRCADAVTVGFWWLVSLVIVVFMVILNDFVGSVVRMGMNLV